MGNIVDIDDPVINNWVTFPTFHMIRKILLFDILIYYMTWHVYPFMHNSVTWQVIIILLSNLTHNDSTFLQVCHSAFMCLYDVSKPTKLQLVREVKMENSGNFKRLEKKAITLTATDNLKFWLSSFFNAVCDVMPMCEKKMEERVATYLRGLQ